MRKELSWKKGVFSNTYKISNYRKLIGILKVDAICSNATGELNGNKYVFKSQGIFSRTVHVVHLETQSLIASIKMSLWGNKAQIRTENNDYTWKFQNLWQTKWSISDRRQTFIAGSHNGFLSKGNISFKESEDFLILSSLYIKNYLITRNSGA